MSLSLEELCAMVNVSYEEVRNIRASAERGGGGGGDGGGEGAQTGAGSGVGPQRDQRKCDVFHTLEEQNRQTAEVSSSDSEEDEAQQLKRKRGPSNWKRNIQKRRRMEGKTYSGKRKDVGEVTRAARTMGPGCVSDACKRSAKRFCHTFSDEDRRKIFQHFWQKMNWDERRVYVAGLVDNTPVARKRSASQDSRRLATLSYHLTVDGEKRRVCKKFFLSTLGVGEWSVSHWVQMTESERNSSQAGAEDEALAALQAFLRDLPKVPAQYCQSSSSKLFLEPVFRSMSELHEVYQRHCEEELQTTPLSREVLTNEFNHLNLALYHPESERCDQCSSHKEGLVEEEGEEVWKKRCLIKEEECEEEEKEQATEAGRTCMDLQTLLLCQKLKVSSFYYRTKLALHNLALRNMVDHSATYQLWAEGAAELSASELASTVSDYLQQQQQQQTHSEEEE